MDLVNNVLAALAGPTQTQRFLRLHTALGSDVLVAETLDGVEQIDGIGFQWTITALSVDAGLQLQPLIGKPALLQLQQADEIVDEAGFGAGVHLSTIAKVKRQRHRRRDRGAGTIVAL